MNPRILAALLSTLISELIILLLPFLDPLVITSNTNSKSYANNLFPLIHHVLSTSDIVTTTAISLRKRKRKRAHNPEPELYSSFAAAAATVNLAIPRSPDSFKLCFGMTCSTFEWLCGLLDPLLECRDPIDSPLHLSAETRLGIGLFRLATGSDFPDISRHFGVSESITQFCVKQLCRVLCTNYRFWVGFPSQNELGSVSSQFESLTGLPNCCGTVHCTRFKITRNNNGLRLNKERSLEESIAAQIVVDSSSRILSIAAGFRGEKNDSTILKSSTLYKDIEGGLLLNSPPEYVNDVAIPQYLIGNMNYPLLPWLIGPFVDPMPASREEKFNSTVQLMRLPGLKAIASLKNWGVLSRSIKAEFKTAVAYIGACSILHNALLMREDYSAFCDEVDAPLLDQNSQDFRNTTFEENLLLMKAAEIRGALATRARELRIPHQTVDPCGSDHLE